MILGATKYMPAGGAIEFGRYHSGETAILVRDPETGEPGLKATVSLVPYGAEDPGPNGVWIKNWSENEGVAGALVDAGVITLTGKTHPINFVEALHGELTESALAERDAP